MTTSIHSRPTFAMMTKPGRKSRELHNAIILETIRLHDREEALSAIASDSPKKFARELAAEQRERVVRLREAISRGKPIGSRKLKMMRKL